MVQRRTRARARVLVALLAQLALAQLAPAAAETWQPLAVGNRWSYAISHQRELSLQETMASRESRSGSYRREIVREGRRRDVAEPLYVTDEIREWRGVPEPERVSTLTAERGGAILEYAMDVGEGMALVEEPLVYGPARVRSGLEWEVGRVRMGGLTMELQGEILGVQNARTPARTFEHCLKVRYTGEVRGMVELEEGGLPVRGGRLEVTQWYAPGVGVVLAEETVTLDVLTTQGVMRSRSQDRYALESFELAGSPAGN